MSELVVSADGLRTATGLVGNAIRVEEGVVTAVGERDTLLGPGTSLRSYDGFITPGLRDAHFHPVAYASSLNSVSLKTAVDFEDLKARLRVAASRRPQHPVIAPRLDDQTLAERALPSRYDLDDAVSDRPAVAHRYCGHVAVANSAALARAGIDAATADPPGGVIDRDPGGEPTGVLRETAIDLVTNTLAGSDGVDAADLVHAMELVAGLGITSLGAMTRTGTGPWSTLGNEVDLLCSVADRLPLNIHVFVIASDPGDLRDAKAMITEAGSSLRWAGLKRFSDGSLGGHTAAMHESFADRPDETGTLRLSARDEELARWCIDEGGRVAIHAIGDRACTEVLDLFERLIDDGAEPEMLRLEHASVLTADDVSRIGRLGVFASVQPAFLASETEWLADRVGGDRLPLTYPFRSLLDSGARLAGGSDCPVEPPNPWPGVAVSRDRAGLVPQQALTASEALAMFTTGGAASLGEPEPLAVGSPADFVVVDTDPVAATPDELRTTTVLDTFVGGEPVRVDRSESTWND